MFFQEPLAALRDVASNKAGRRAVTLAVWHKSELNPFSYLVTDVMSRYVETPSSRATSS
jgi:hypothetical protein